MTPALQTFLFLVTIAVSGLFSYTAGYSQGLVEGKGLKVTTRLEKIHNLVWAIIWFSTLASGIAALAQWLFSL